MLTLWDYFESDFNQGAVVWKDLPISGHNLDVVVRMRIHLVFQSATKFVSFYVPTSDSPLNLLLFLLSDSTTTRAEALSMTFNVGEVEFPGETSRAFWFSGRVYFYCEDELPPSEKETFKAAAAEKGIHVQLRDPGYVKERVAKEVPVAFISHDSRDKTAIATPLAQELLKRGSLVWYDEFSLKVGDNLRESIERGIRNCRKCIIILTPHFLSNTGWTAVEFDSIMMKQIIECNHVILPVWHCITKEEVYAYSPFLSNIKAVRWSSAANVAKPLLEAIAT